MKKHIDENRYYNEAWISNEGIILKQLAHDGQMKKKLTEDDLIRYDQIDHVGGIRNTLILADQIQFKKDMHVLDVGGGMGGAARFLAYKYGCKVRVLDLIPERCHGGIKLTRMTGLTKRVTFQAADAQHTPFRDQVFDMIWSQDAFDSIENKDLLLQECCRLLKPGGQLIFTDHLQGPFKAVPDGIYLWPDDTNKITFDTYQLLLEKYGFNLLNKRDLTLWAITSLRRVNSAILDGHGQPIKMAQGNLYYEKVIAFINSLLGYLEGGAVQYGLFKARRE
jgi:ubiquinone/menaquinone biosynthesis C-methylase UbiE